MKNICSTCEHCKICDVQISSLKLARYGLCKSRNLKLAKEYSEMSDTDLIEVLNKEYDYPKMVWFTLANAEYRKRFSSDFIRDNV